MKPRLYLDVSRIVTRIEHSTPTGIDRVEYEYARAFARHEHDFDTTGIVTTPWFCGAVGANVLARSLTQIERVWGLELPAEADPVYLAVQEFLGLPFNPNATKAAHFLGPERARSARLAVVRLGRNLIRSPVRLKRRLQRTMERPAVYLHSSHTQLERPELFRWLADANVRPAFFIHDAIPIEYPEFCGKGADAQHAARLKTVSALAGAVIVNSSITAKSIRGFWQTIGLREPPVEVVPLGIAKAFCGEHSERCEPTPVPFFICVGTIEPRKNHLFLFEVWRRLVERLGSNAPRLVLVARRGWENENAVDIIERSRTLAPFLVEVQDLTDAGLACLMRQAVALVAPSITEGYGLPIVEAFAVGLPVIASDIPAHREVGGNQALLLDPLDGPSWVEAILRAASQSGAGQNRLASPPAAGDSWSKHTERVAAVLKALCLDSPPSQLDRL